MHAPNHSYLFPTIHGRLTCSLADQYQDYWPFTSQVQAPPSKEIFCPALHPQESRRTLSPLLLSRGPNTTALLISVSPAPPGRTRPRSHQAPLSGLAHPAPQVSHTQPPAPHWPPLAPHALHCHSQRPHPLSPVTRTLASLARAPGSHHTARASRPGPANTAPRDTQS